MRPPRNKRDGFKIRMADKAFCKYALDPDRIEKYIASLGPKKLKRMMDMLRVGAVVSDFEVVEDE